MHLTEPLATAKSHPHGAGPYLLAAGIALAAGGAILLLGALGPRLKDSSPTTRQRFKAVGAGAMAVGIVLLVVGAVTL